jgi:hypothetical protein
MIRTDPVLGLMMGGVWGRIFLDKPYSCNNGRETAGT